MQKFIQENWISLLAILIAIVGGVPGIIEILNHFKNRSIFRFTLENLTIGEMFIPETKGLKAMVFLSGTVSNKGTVPLAPEYFDLMVRLHNGWINFERMLIPRDVKLQSTVQNIDLKEPHETDLQLFKAKINEVMPLRGHLMFVSSKITREILEENIKDLKLRLVCVDIFNKKHKTNVALNLSDIVQGTFYPKHGVSVIPKK